MKAKLDLVLTSATINPEKAGGDDGEKGSALRFDGDVLIDKLDGIFTDEKQHPALVEMLYGAKDGHDLLARDVKTIALGLEMEKVTATLSGPVVEDERIKFTGCKLNSVALEPKHGRAIGITLKLYVHPADDQWNKIAELVRKELTLKLSGGREVEDEKDDDDQPSLLQPARPTVQ